jgi:hypothetical protein
MGNGKMAALVLVYVAAGLSMIRGITHGSLVIFLFGLISALAGVVFFFKWIPERMQPERQPSVEG